MRISSIGGNRLQTSIFSLKTHEYTCFLTTNTAGHMLTPGSRYGENPPCGTGETEREIKGRDTVPFRNCTGKMGGYA